MATMKMYEYPMKKCAVCGKEFYATEDYVFKRYKGNGKEQERVWFCKWSHLRQWEQEEESRTGRKRRGRCMHEDG